jgi:hypothetical protein
MQTVVVEDVLIRTPRRATLELPAGWYRVLSGAIKPGDRCLDNGWFWRTGAVRWYELTRVPPPGRPFSTADWYGCLIRPGEPVEVLCPRCHEQPVRLGYRYCRGCCHEFVVELRREEGRSPT